MLKNIQFLWIVLLCLNQFRLSAQQPANKNRLNDLEVISRINSLKSELNIIQASLKLQDLSDDQQSVYALKKHANHLNYYYQQLNTAHFNFNFLRSLYKSFQEEENQIEAKIKQTQGALEDLKETLDSLNLIHKSHIFDKKFEGKFPDLSSDLKKDFHKIEATLKKNMKTYLRNELILIEIQTQCIEQKEKVKEKIVKAIHQIFSKKTRSDVKKQNFSHAVKETYRSKLTVISFYLMHETIINFIVLAGILISLFIHLKIRLQAPKVKLKENLTRFIAFVFQLSVFVPIFYFNTPLVIDELLLLTSGLLLFMHISLRKSLSILFTPFMFLTLAFVCNVFQNILIHEFTNEFYFVLVIQLLFFTANITYLYVKMNHTKDRNKIMAGFFTLVLQIVNFTLFLIGFEDFSKILLTTIIHGVFGATIYFLFYDQFKQNIYEYKKHLLKKLPVYFETEISSLLNLFLMLVKTMVILSWAIVVFHAFNTEYFIIRAYDWFMNSQFKLGNQNFTVGWILLILIVLFASYMASKILSFYLDYISNVYQQKNFSYKIILKLIVFCVSFYLVIILSGIELDRLTVLISALGLGLGFGLQNIVANLSAGLFLVFENKIEIDDRIEIDGYKGLVKEIGTRATRIYCADGSDVLIPNSDFLENTVKNWNLGDDKRRIELRLQIDFLSDVELAVNLLKEIIENEETINKNFLHEVKVSEISDNGVVILMHFWYKSNIEVMQKSSAILMKVSKTFNSHGIIFFEKK